MPGKLGEEYVCPPTTLPPIIAGGTFPKDKGQFSSRIGQVLKQAAKVPGPGAYSVHASPSGQLFAFAKGPRDAKRTRGVSPDPCTYQGSKRAVLPRTTGCVMSKGKKMTFIDLAKSHSHRAPGPVTYHPKDVLGHIQSRTFAPRSSSKAEPREEKKSITPGPGSYDINYQLIEERPVNVGFAPKCRSLVDAECKISASMPGPGHYKECNPSRVSRATKLLQIYHYARNPMTGYF
eukprot:GEMP01041960.1.p1 GENE.GEMP01041960.1~~GEMP01041960.1.p1  ORF type:complete len:234 (+),score=36.39 GEMP01041960.1:341-1042(+)